MKDDLGKKRYLNPEYAHSVLLNGLCEMIDADDFCEIISQDGDEREYVFPALEKMKANYPWVQDIIDMLEEDNQAMGAFFFDFNKAFIQYAKVDSNGKSMILNAPMAQ